MLMKVALTLTTVFCRHGAKNPVRIIGGSGKECYTVLECCNAMGDFIPPYILYKAQNLYTELCQWSNRCWFRCY